MVNHPPRGNGISTADLADLAQQAHQTWPDGRLHKNDAGNLAVEVHDQYVGWLDLFTGEVHDFAERNAINEH